MKPQFETRVEIDRQSHQVRLERRFAAAPDAVFRALTDARLIPRWWGPARLETRVEANEMRHGGRWRYIQREASGQEFAFRGVVHLVEPPRLLINTFEFEGAPGRVVLQIASLTPLEGGTLFSQQAVFAAAGDLSGMVDSGMEAGERESLERLAQLLGSG